MAQSLSAVFPDAEPGMQDDPGTDDDSGAEPEAETDRHFLKFLPELYAQEALVSKDDLSCVRCGLAPTSPGHK